MRALHAEWIKLRTVAGTGWLVLAAVVLTVGLSVAVCAAVSAGMGPGQDPTRLSLTGVDLGQAVVAILAVLALSGEYGSGLIHVTLAATPRRPAVLAAKATLVGGLALAAGVVAVGGSLLAGRLLLPGRGFTPAHGYALLSLASGPTLRAAAGSVLYLALIALLSLGIAGIVRDAAAAVGVVLGLLYLFPILASLVGNPTWQRHLEQAGPMSAGLAVQATVGLTSLPVRPWVGLAVLAAWAAAALLIGGLALCLRDA
ncbi:MAG TPA: hypothetical protein VFN57_18670 [Thermomicrobiaceae bacterium]|nr:hypothetical protein [Thermomicrobiaceae bacterium]